MTTTGAASDEKIIKMTTFLFQCMAMKDHTSLRISVNILFQNRCNRLFSLPMPYTWLSSWWTSDILWIYTCTSTLVQVMACCLFGRSHYKNQCWLINCKTAAIVIRHQYFSTENVYAQGNSKYSCMFYNFGANDCYHSLYQLLSIPLPWLCTPLLLIGSAWSLD